MAKRRGIIVTIIILAAITAASFSIWLIPQKESTSFVVSNFKAHLESIQDKQKVIADEIEMDLQAMLAGTVTPDNFIMRAEASTSQINALIIELVESKATQEWNQRYLNYGEFLKNYDSYLRETIVLANKIKEGNSNIQENLERLELLKNETESFTIEDDETKP